MSEVIITVRGEHEARVAPEEGIARVSVRAEGPERGSVVERIAALAEPLRTELTERQARGSVREWSSQRVAVWADRPWNAQGKRLALVHHASVEFTAVFTDFTALSWWVTEVAERDGLQVDGVVWRLTPETHRAAERDVAAHAVEVAVARATAYAEAIGLATVHPREIADLGLLTRGHGEAEAVPTTAMELRSAAFDSAAGGPAVAFQPEEIVVTAAVEARFTAR